MATGGSVVKQSQSVTAGASWGQNATYTDGSTLTCNAQEMDAEESLQYDARGQKRLYNVFFATDPTLEVGNRLKLTKMNNTTLTTARYLRVLATEFEGTPDGSVKLWISVCEEITTRNES